jgi:hypothetical protein
VRRTTASHRDRAPPRARRAASRREPGPLTGLQLVAGTVTLSAATFMVVLDTSIANVSIPAIAGDMGVSASQGTWVITSFAVANAIAVPLTAGLRSVSGKSNYSRCRRRCSCSRRGCAALPPISKR